MPDFGFVIEILRGVGGYPYEAYYYVLVPVALFIGFRIVFKIRLFGDVVPVGVLLLF